MHIYHAYLSSVFLKILLPKTKPAQASTRRSHNHTHSRTHSYTRTAYPSSCDPLVGSVPKRINKASTPRQGAATTIKGVRHPCELPSTAATICPPPTPSASIRVGEACGECPWRKIVTISNRDEHNHTASQQCH